MRATEFFTCPCTRRRIYADPLGPYIDEFTDQLQQQGYSTGSIRTKIRVVAGLSRWLRNRDLSATDVDADRRKRFLAYRKRTGCYVANDAMALRDIEVLLRSQGLINVSKPPRAISEREHAEEDFRAYLSQERGLSAATLRAYLPFVSRFLSECFADGAVRVEVLTSTDVTGFVQRHAHAHSHSRAQMVVKALRAFLRYLHHHGRIPTDLAACVPSVAQWSFSRLPAFLRPDQVEQVLNRCDRTSARGRRDYAMLVLFQDANDSCS